MIGIGNKKVPVRPEGEALKKLVTDKGYSQVGKDFGVSDNAVRKWLKVDGIVLDKIKKGRDEIICEITGKKILRDVSAIDRHQHHFKDLETANDWQRMNGKLANLNQEKYEKLKQTYSVREIARKYACSHRTLIKKFEK